jgi:hypothetical protein
LPGDIEKHAKGVRQDTRVYPKVSGLSHNEIKKQQTLVEKQHKGLWRQTHQTDSQNIGTTASSGRELYHLQFSFQAASPETFGYTPEFGLSAKI